VLDRKLLLLPFKNGYLFDGDSSFFLVNLIDFGSGRKEYKDYDHFVIKIVLMNQVDEYGRDKWGSALDLAAVEVDRLAIRALRSGDLDALTLEDTRGLFASRRLFLVNIAKANKK